VTTTLDLYSLYLHIYLREHQPQSRKMKKKYKTANRKKDQYLDTACERKTETVKKFRHSLLFPF